MSTSILLNPKKLDRHYPDQRSQEIMKKTIDFFEGRGKRKLKEDDHARTWYADFLEFIKDEKIFYSLLTPSEFGGGEIVNSTRSLRFMGWLIGTPGK